MPHTPKTTVVTPLFNAENTFDDTAQSLLQQTDRDWEWIVVDNGSTDTGLMKAKNWATRIPNMTVLSCAQQGPGPTRNTAISQAKGQRVAFLDADDIWHPEKLERQNAFMDTEGLDMSWTATWTHRDGQITGLRPVRRHISPRDHLTKREAISCLTVMVKTQHLQKNLMPALFHGEDFVTWWNILSQMPHPKHTAGGLNLALGFYREGGGLSANKIVAARRHWHTLRHSLNLSPAQSLTPFLHHASRGVTNRTFWKKQAKNAFTQGFPQSLSEALSQPPLAAKTP